MRVDSTVSARILPVLNVLNEMRREMRNQGATLPF